MIYAAFKDGVWTGATYPTRLPAAVQHHAAFGERLLAVTGLVETDTGFVEEPSDVATASAVARQRMLDWIADLTAPMTSKYPAAEQAMWPVKLPAARAIMAGTGTELDELMFTDEAALAGVSVATCAAATLAKGVPFARISSAVSGLRQSLDTALVLAETADDVPEILAGAMAQAATLAAAFGLPNPDKTGV